MGLGGCELRLRVVSPGKRNLDSGSGLTDLGVKVEGVRVTGLVCRV